MLAERLAKEMGTDTLRRALKNLAGLSEALDKLAKTTE